MSNRYKGAIISATPPTTTGGESGVASGAWTLEQQMQLQAAGLWPSPYIPKYIEDVFSTYLYTGNGATNQTITNSIDLSTKGGLVWIKNRPTTPSHFLSDSGSSFASYMSSNATTANTSCSSFFAATTSGFTLTGAGGGLTNNTGDGYVSWTFREQAKFFDVVTYTGTGVARTVAHNLGSVPGCIIVKRTDTAGFDWLVYHRSTGNTNRLLLNDTVPAASGTSFWNDTTPTSTVFTVGTNVNGNASGGTYVAYLFAHDAGGFGLTGTDNVISCGSFTTDGAAAATVSLGYEPQWVLFKRTDSATNGDWVMFDNMRGLPATGTGSVAARLIANTAAAENPLTGDIKITSTGFVIDYVPSASFIYIAIRRGPMKVPTLGTNVFAAVSRTGTDANAVVTAGFPPDFLITKNRFGTASPIRSGVLDRLRSLNRVLTTADVAAEDTVQTDIIRSWNMTGVTLGPDANTSVFNWSANTYINYMFRRAAGYFDEACYTGTGSNTTQAHNLTTVPELIFVKRRNASAAWQVYSSALANTEYLVLDSTAAKATGATRWNSTTPTSSVFSLGTDATVNASGGTYIAYLFASAPGVSKVGSYTGNGSTQTIDCGFGAGGARFVLIKRTDATGDWYTYDTVRGMTVVTDPYLWLNTGAAEVASLGSVTTVSTGFALNAAIVAAINTNAASYIFLAIA